MAPGVFQIRPKPDFELIPEYQDPAAKVVQVVQEKIFVASVSAKVNYRWRSDESRVFCTKCQTWQRPSWLPQNEREKSAKTWFECSVCGCRHIELHYLSSEELELQLQNVPARCDNNNSFHTSEMAADISHNCGNFVGENVGTQVFATIFFQDAKNGVSWGI